MRDWGWVRARSFAFPLLVLVLSLVAACGGSESSGDGAEPEGTRASFKDDKCKPGGTFVMGLEEEPASLLPASVRQTTATTRISHLVYSQLLELDQDGEPRASLAEDYETSDDGLTYTFKLKPAKWHDGRPLTSKDVVATIDYLQGASLDTIAWELIASVETPDDRTVVITLKEPYAEFLTALANPNDSPWILPSHILKGGDPEKSSLAKEPMGSGPFRFVRWDGGSQIELERNEDYFEEGRPCLDRVVARFMPDAAARAIAYESGEVDWLYSYMVPLEQLPGYVADDKSQVVLGGLGTAVSDFLLLNSKNRYLGNQKVREAIAYAIDREELNDVGYYGFGKMAHSTINSELKDVYTDEFDQYETDVEKANALLDEAGFPRGDGGTRFKVGLRVRPDRAFESRMADAMRTQLAKVGIEVRIQPGDAAGVYDLVYSKFDFDMVVQLHTTGPDPGTQIPVMFGKAGIGAPAGNGARHVDPELERLFEEVRTELDDERRQEMWREVQEITMRTLTWIPLVEYPNIQLISPKFENVIGGPLDYLGNLEFARQAE